MGHITTPSLIKVIRTSAGLLGLGLLLIFAGAVGVSAQEESLTVTLTKVESRGFPEVTAWLAVSDGRGPVDSLTATHFEVVEDDRQSVANPITVVADSIKNLRLVFAIDTSTIDEASLADAKATVISMIDNFGPGDRAALLSFGSKVNLEYNFTNNTTALQQAVSRLSPKGEKTALHQAVLDAATKLAEFPDGRKAIIIITANYDNTGGPAVDQIIAQLQRTGTPLYVIGIGKKVQGPHPLKTETPLTGGQFLSLNKTDQLRDTLFELENSLRQGYKISFQSNLKADNLPHDLSIRVSGDNKKGVVVGRFVAIPNRIVITPQGIAANQTVKGVMGLAAEVISPGKLVGVSYLLDDQLLAEVSSLPYNFAWDTTATPPGNHLLTVKAVDQAGNEAQVGLNLVVAAPLQVSLSTTGEQIQIGQQATVQIKVESLADIARLDLLVDSRVVERKQSPPYHFSLDSTSYPAGDHRVSVRAEDTLGRVAESSLDITFVPAPPPPPGQIERFIRSQRVQSGLLMIIASITVLAIILLTAIVIIALNRMYRNRSKRQTRLEIVNMGNIQSRYSLAGRDTQNKLDFQFMSNGVTLPVLSPQLLEESESGIAGAGVRPAQGVPPAKEGNRAAAYSKPHPGWFQTPFVEPTDSFWTDLRIIPRRPYRKEICTFEIISQAIDQPNAPKIKDHGVVEVGGLFWGWRYLSFLAVLVTSSWLIWQIVSLAIWRLLAVDTTPLLSLVW